MKDLIVAITGSSGFIGNHLSKALIDQNFEILKLDLQDGYDITDWKIMKNIPRFNAIIHLAAKSFVPDSFIHPRDFYNTNFLATLHILELAKKYSAKVIYISSYLYGSPLSNPINENHPVNPHNPYGQSKLICENLCKGYHRDFNIPVIILRPFNIYGPGQGNSFLIPSIINQLKEKKILLSDPRPKRDYIYISDVVEAIIQAVKFEATNFEIFNIGSGISYSVSEIVEKIIQISGIQSEIIFKNEFRKNEVLDTVSDISKAKSLLGWYPKVDISTGLTQIISHGF